MCDSQCLCVWRFFGFDSIGLCHTDTSEKRCVYVCLCQCRTPTLTLVLTFSLFIYFKFNLSVSTCLCRCRVRCLSLIGLSYTLSYDQIWITNEITQIPSFNITNIHTQVLGLELNKHHKKLLSMLQLTHQSNTSCKYHSKFKYPVYYL